MFLPSIQPNSLRERCNSPEFSLPPALLVPILQTLFACCAFTASGHTTAPQAASPMKSRRLMPAPKALAAGIVLAVIPYGRGRNGLFSGNHRHVRFGS